ncbi:MAG: transcriptional coactivator p15/PC4 family protein [Candidatus Methanofishera endochildressiae]|uniref:Transcriptional coactivator p15/PC4 family protein n=1 Tax=Candidatus Methanofishera endochildressiae TaxID=2738884 RepID=A0A7Z0MN23_9GAMM|nr:transcriptional coactivator p15/PC4 family protein [Candidatus Methanofishera endochildressiae]
MASDIQPLRVHLGRLLYLELKEWNGTKRVDLRFWKEGTVPTKEGVSLHLDQWKALCNMSDVIDELLTRVIENEPVDWRYHIGDDVYVTLKAPYVCINIRKHFIPAGEWTYRPTKRGVALHFGEWKELKQIIPLLEEREPELRELIPLYRTDL